MEMTGFNFDEAKKDIFGYDSNNIKERLRRKTIIKEVKKAHVKNFNWIREKSISLSQEVSGAILPRYKEVLRRFCNDRKIPSEHDILICYEGDFKGRVIIPVVDGANNIIYFQARRLPGANIEPKYKNPSVEKDSIILNWDRFDRSKYIVVTEGLIDAFMIGDQGTACLGAYLSEDFISQLLKKTDKGIIVAFDNDDTGKLEMKRFMFGVEPTGKRKRKKRRPANKYAKKVKYFIFPKEYQSCKDINNIRVDFDVKGIYDMIVKNSLSYTGAATNILLKEKL
jgi:hypothetical protein